MGKTNFLIVVLLLGSLVLVGAGCGKKLKVPGIGNELDNLRKENCQLSLEKYKSSMTLEQCIENAKNAEKMLRENWGKSLSDTEIEKKLIENYKLAIEAIKKGEGGAQTGQSGNIGAPTCFNDPSVTPHNSIVAYCNALMGSDREGAKKFDNATNCAKLHECNIREAYKECSKLYKTDYCESQSQDQYDYFLRCVQGKEDAVKCFGW